MFAGEDLRCLLHQTANAMTVLGAENVSREELLLRMGIDGSKLEAQLEGLEGKELVSRLMISFFFKGGHPELACEFSHKSFREYLFAEGLVEALKAYGSRHHGRHLSERAADTAWKDFDEDDPRHELSRTLSGLLGPQWLTPEVAEHVAKLVYWEIRRAEGAHLHPQPGRRSTSGAYEWLPPYAFNVARDAGLRDAAQTRLSRIGLTAVDAHLGDALCLLNVVVHDGLLKSESGLETPDGK